MKTIFFFSLILVALTAAMPSKNGDNYEDYDVLNEHGFNEV